MNTNPTAAAPPPTHAAIYRAPGRAAGPGSTVAVPFAFEGGPDAPPSSALWAAAKRAVKAAGFVNPPPVRRVIDAHGRVIMGVQD